MKVTETWLEDKAYSNVRKKLRAHNIATVGERLTDDQGTVEIAIVDHEGEVVAGITASIHWKQMYIDYLWVDESLRGQNKGSELLAKAEQVAREQECRYIHLTTFSFQAPGFYQKNGFEVFGVLEDSPFDGYSQYFLKKSLR